MKQNSKNLEEFKQFLVEKDVQETEIPSLLEAITGFNKFLERINETISDFAYGKLIEYADQLSMKDRNAARQLILGLWRYFPFIGKHEHVEELLDIAESSSAMNTLYQRVADWHGKELRDEIFKGIAIPPLGAHPEKKPQVTKIVMKRLEEKLGKEKTKKLLRPCLHGGPPVGAEKEEFRKLKNLDEFLKKKHQRFIMQVEKHRDDGTAMFAQLVNDDIIEYVKTIPTMGAGVRDKNKIIVTKIPYQINHFLNADTEPIKRYYLCYCPWIRGAIKDGTENEVSPNFCYCSGGFFKLYWDEMFDHSVNVELLETALWGDMACKFAIDIPTEIMNEYVLEK